MKRLSRQSRESESKKSPDLDNADNEHRIERCIRQADESDRIKVVRQSFSREGECYDHSQQPISAASY